MLLMQASESRAATRLTPKVAGPTAPAATRPLGLKPAAQRAPVTGHKLPLWQAAKKKAGQAVQKVVGTGSRPGEFSFCFNLVFLDDRLTPQTAAARVEVMETSVETGSEPGEFSFHLSLVLWNN